MNELIGENGILVNCWKYFVLGLVQGITEFLPISSTAHLKVVPLMLGWGDPGLSVSAAIQLGSIAAVIIYFKSDLLKVLKSLYFAIRSGEWQSQPAKMGIALLTGTVPIIFAGIGVKIFWPNFESSYIRSITSIALVSILMAFLLAFSESYGRRRKLLREASGKDGFVIGLGQMLAIIPGVSRSGVTLTTALFYGYKREDAARFSFLLGVPSILISGLAESNNAFRLTSQTSFIPLFVGIITSAIVSWVAIDWLIKYLQKHSTNIFIFYRLIFGISLLIWSTKIS